MIINKCTINSNVLYDEVSEKKNEQNRTMLHRINWHFALFMWPPVEFSVLQRKCEVMSAAATVVCVEWLIGGRFFAGETLMKSSN